MAVEVLATLVVGATLGRLSSVLGINFHIDVTPDGVAI
jgi:hypothetical protein